MGLFAPVGASLSAWLGTRLAMTIGLVLIGVFGVLRGVVPGIWLVVLLTLALIGSKLDDLQKRMDENKSPANELKQLASDVKDGQFTALEGNNADAVNVVPRQLGGGANIVFIRVEGDAPAGTAVDPLAPLGPVAPLTPVLHDTRTHVRTPLRRVRRSRMSLRLTAMDSLTRARCTAIHDQARRHHREPRDR